MQHEVQSTGAMVWTWPYQCVVGHGNDRSPRTPPKGRKNTWIRQHGLDMSEMSEIWPYRLPFLSKPGVASLVPPLQLWPNTKRSVTYFSCVPHENGNKTPVMPHSDPICDDYITNHHRIFLGLIQQKIHGFTVCRLDRRAMAHEGSRTAQDLWHWHARKPCCQTSGSVWARFNV